MVIFLLALIGTLVVMIVLTFGRLVFGRRELFKRQTFIRWFISYFIVNYILSLLILYFTQPALTGPFGGWQWTLWPLAISCIANLFAFARPAADVLGAATAASQGRFSSSNSTIRMPGNFSRGAVAAGIFGLIFVAIVGIVATILITIFTTWFDANAKVLAAIPNVHMMTSSTLPPTDANNIVLVSQNIASYKGQQVLGSNGQNLGSAYNLDPSSYTLQSINHHLYYVAPLAYNNVFVNLSSPTTPGFVVVDAEDPQQVPQLHTEESAKLRYLPGALLNQDLLRHVYLSGYTNGRLIDPTLELDDSYHPYWTISLMQPTRGYTGDVLSKVLLVDAHTGTITEYDPQNVPTWVDRVMPASTVSQYLQWWGLYHAAPWFNPSGLGQQSPASDPELLYNSGDQPVWLVPMTSSSANDNSSTGVFLFNTHKNEADFYPLSGLGIGSNVTSTFSSTRANIRNYNVTSTQLYQIDGVPTWVAIYSQSTDSGDIFQAVGVVDAHELNGNNVQFEPTLSAALADYSSWLLQQGNPGGSSGGTTGPTIQTVTGKVLRISSVQQGTNTIYYLYLQIGSQKVIFTANLALSAKLPLVQPGDTVTVSYLPTTARVINIQKFDDTSINLGTPPTTGTPGVGATPTP